ncbi:hypothetical protein B0T26DRAFT_677149 [Lasiosphaeria miniovina]|uniref:Uncharacterized protein n=1 Tax=Lasiosphaeria miniovina TaxID=1954250 RepID=A0AA40ABQ8_9PEZI|nr:uncharacterized protein B0T26DRAFT_677149 [Lasiosphaeria miniovina]KAK0712723.1 hypothetical protein B0T26DRAFT_677149 [Lasiosphaeria miniovina]
MNNTTHEIRIVNDSNSPKTYGIYTGPTKVTSGGFQRASSILWHKTDELQPGDETTFEYSPEIHGFVGTSNTPVVLGDELNQGTRFLVEDRRDMSGSNMASTPRDTFTMATVTGFPSPNRFVVGVARKDMLSPDGRVSPVAAVELVSGLAALITPSHKIIVSALSEPRERPGWVHRGPFARNTYASVDFAGMQSRADVVEANNGSFKVECF